MRLARAFDSPNEFQRLATPLAKYWVCKRATPHTVEALEVLGGNGFVEDSSMPRLLRDSPLNSIWEGSGNVISLDVLRAAATHPASVESLFAEIDLAGGADRRLDRGIAGAKAEAAAMSDLEGAPHAARRVAERLALVLQASLVLRHAPPFVADAFIASRIDGDRGLAFGTLPPGVDAEAIVERHRPTL
jgi:putative acyl-CoA dehydrogenase